MAAAGYCRLCGQYVYLNDQWGCANGHPWNEISNWYDPGSGTPIVPYWLQHEEGEVHAPSTGFPAETPFVPAPVPATPAGPSDRLTLLADVLAVLGQYPGYRSHYGTDTDIEIDNQIADANWGTGKKKVEYSAIMKAVEAERTVYFWELLKESGGGLNFGGFDAEMTTTSGMKRFGTKKEVVLGPNGVAMDYTWDYGATRRIIEDAVERHGWKLKVVLRKKSATW